MPKIFWSLLRIVYMVHAVFFATILSIQTFPPNDGQFAPTFVGCLMVNCCGLVVCWAFLPWPKDEKTAPKTLPATPAAPPEPPLEYKQELEMLDGQDAIDAFLDRRWKGRLAGVLVPECRKKTPKDEWKAIATGGDFATNNLVFIEIPGTKIVFDLAPDRDFSVDFSLKACVCSYGAQMGIRVDGVHFEGPRSAMADMIVPLTQDLTMKLGPGRHIAVVVLRQSLDASVPAIVAKSMEMPVVLLVKRH